MTDTPVKFYKVTSLPLTLDANSLYIVQSSPTTFDLYVTDIAGAPRRMVLRPVINIQEGDYTLTPSDMNSVVVFASETAVDCTVPQDLGVGFNCLVLQAGEGTVTFVPDGTTIQSADDAYSLRTQFSGASLLMWSDNIFSLTGDLA